MSKVTKYYCDQCKEEVANGETLTSVKLELNPYSSYKSKRFDKVNQYFDICDNCTERLGFLVRKVDTVTVDIQPTTANKLYEIIAQMIEEQHV